MKTSIELPDQLIAEVKSLAAREQRQVEDLMVELVRAGIDSRTQSEQSELRVKAIEWLEEWIKLGNETLHDVPSGPTATEILEADRYRLEREP